jgi:hypothetical protein
MMTTRYYRIGDGLVEAPSAAKSDDRVENGEGDASVR